MLKRFIDKGFVVGSNWVKEHDDGVYDTLLEMLEEFTADSSNSADDEDLKEFKKGNWLVGYYFTEGYDDDSIELQITAGRDVQMLSNQPPWIDEIVTPEDWGLEIYLDMVAQ